MPEGLPGASPASAARAPRRFRTGLAWAAILLLVATAAAFQARDRPREESDRSFADVVLEMQVRMQYGVRALVGEASAAGFEAEALRESLERARPGTRMRFAVFVGDLSGPAAAREELERLDALLEERGRTLDPGDAAVRDALRALYAADGPAHRPEAVEALSPDRRDALLRRLGWFGRLALAPEGSPDRAAAMEGTKRLAGLLFLFTFAGLGLLALGFAAAILYWVRVAVRGARFRFAPSPTPPGVYAETFAVWLAAFLLLNLGAALVGGLLDSRTLRLAAVGAAQALSLLALAWPVARGVPFRQVREDLGLRLSATPFGDAIAGVGIWILGLPVMAIVGVATFLAWGLLSRFRGAGDPLEAPDAGHPIAEEIAGGLPWPLVFLLVSVLAPIVEEVFFRGALYRHLRDSTRGRGRALSILLSAAASGLLFGAVHPQGLLIAPLLAAIAWPLVHARESRDSLVAPMAAHALHNGVVTAGVWLLTGA